MILLAIDTSGPSCAVCLARGAQGTATTVLAERQERIGRGHAERLLPMVEEALGAAGLGFGDIGRIAVAVGPGSFTGVRVGVAAARGLALALDIKAFGISSLQALATEAAAATGARMAVAALAGPRGEAYALAQDIGHDAPHDAAHDAPHDDAHDGPHDAARLPPTLIAPDELIGRLIGWRRQPMALIGSAARPLVEALVREGFDAILVREADAPEVGWMARLALAGEGASPPRPLYLRPPDAKPQAGRAVARA